VMYLRRSLQEHASFQKECSKADRGTLKALAQHPKAVMTVICLTIGGTVAFYTFTTYMQKFLVNTAKFSNGEATMISTLTLIVFMLLQPVFGLLSDKIGRKPLLIGFGILGTLATVPIMTSLSTTKAMWPAFALIMCALIITSGYTSINAVVKAELFPVKVRALGVGFPYAVAVSIFGGTAESLALLFKEHHHPQYFYWYVSVCIAISLLAYIIMPDTKKHSKIED
jgi:MHS family alpha-ketoglutarate permease-like MFS transporter